MPPLSLVIVAVSTVIAIELFLRLPFWTSIQLILRTSRKASSIVSSRHISEHWKEKVLLHYSWIIAGQSLRLAAMFFLIILVVVSFAAGSDFLLKPPQPSLQVVAGWRGLVVASIVSVVYWALRQRIAR